MSTRGSATQPPTGTDSNRRDGVLFALVAFVSVAGVAYATAWFRDIPLITPDEIGYLGMARQLATGTGPDMGDVAAGHGAISLLWWPLHVVIDNPATLYRVAIAVNALVLGASALTLLLIARELSWPITPSVAAAAGIASLWPSHLIHVQFLWTETMFRLVFLLVVFASLALTRSRSTAWSVGFALLCILAFALHPRAFPTYLLAIVFIGSLVAAGRLSWLRGFAAFGALAGGYWVVGALNDILQTPLWGASESALTTASLMLDRILTGQGIQDSLNRILGQIWYQCAASLGLIAVGAVAIWRVASDATMVALRASVIFVLSAVTLTAVAGAVQTVDATRLDHLAYGRYLDGVTGALLFLGITSVLRARDGRWVAPTLVFAGALAVVLMALLLVSADGMTLKSAGLGNIGGLLVPLLALRPLSPDPAIALFGAGTAWAIVLGAVILVTSRHVTSMMCVLVALVVSGAVLGTIEFRDLTERRNGMLSEARELYSWAGSAPIVADRSARTPSTYVEQYMLHRMPFRWVDLRGESLNAGSFVLVRAPAHQRVTGTCIGRFTDDRMLIRTGAAGRPCPANDDQSD